MIEKVVHRFKLGDPQSAQDDLRYWLSRPQEERVLAVERLRGQFYGHSERLQRVARVVKQQPS